jgi:predicted TIM-barrel fold metal-dependent hydrolase
VFETLYRNETWGAIERARSEAALAAELADTRLLQGLSAELVAEEDRSALHEKIVDAALSIMRADFASFQIFDRERSPNGELRLIALRGFSADAARRWEWIGPDARTPCGEALRTEARSPRAAGTSRFDSQLGFAVRRWCAPVLGLEAFAPAGEYLRRRAELGAAEVSRRLLRAAGVSAWLVDTGYQGERVATPGQVAAASGAPAYAIVRLEAVAEAVARNGTSAAGFAGAFGAALEAAIAGGSAGRGGSAGQGWSAGRGGPGESATESDQPVRVVGLKSIAAYRHGLDFDPARPSATEVAAAAGRLLRAIDAARIDGGTALARGDDPPEPPAGASRGDTVPAGGHPRTPDGPEPSAGARLDDEVLPRHLIWTGIDTGLPLQFHAGFGDPDARLHRANPALLHDFLAATQASGGPVMLLHCYPYHREAGYLANVFTHVYLDVGEALNHVGARSAAVLAEALELAPFGKMLYSSDAFGLAELHYLGALGFRRDLARVTGEFVAQGLWSAADAGRVAEMVGSGNAARTYRLTDAPSHREDLEG